MTIRFDYSNDEISSSPTVLVHGSTDRLRTGVIQFINNDNKVFPPGQFEVNNGQFIAHLHLSPGEPNRFKVQVFEGIINGTGFAEFRSNHARDEGELVMQYKPGNNKPYFMCLVVAADSPGVYDMPKYRLNRGEVPSIDMAVRKLKVMSRLYQAYCQDEMRRNGFGNRTFSFIEEQSHHQGVFGYNVDSPAPHQEVKIFILRSEHPVSYIRDKNRAQQGKGATDGSWTWKHAIDLVKKSPEIIGFQKQYKTKVQVAAMYLDSHWDKQQQLITAHAALGGGTGEMQMSVFGSHGLHSFPNNFPQVTPAFLDATHLTTNEVANDCNQCGTSWECLNICSGAFLHEIGHGLGCPHQVNGIMLRDYVRFNRAFVTRENQCLRTNSNGAVIGTDGRWDGDCHWNFQDIMRFLYHASFALPIDDFDHVVRTTMTPDDCPENVGPSALKVDGGVVVKSQIGFYSIECKTDGLARFSVNFPPKRYGGPGLQHQLYLTYDKLADDFRRANPKDFRDNFEVTCMSLAGDWNSGNFKEWVQPKPDDIVEGNYGCGPVKAYKSAPLGNYKNTKQQAFFDGSSLTKIEVFTHYAVRGIRFTWKGGENAGSESKPDVPPRAPPKVPARDYLKNKLESKFEKLGLGGGGGHRAVAAPQGPVSGGTSSIGRLESNRNEFNLEPGEHIVRIHVRSGAWVDGVSFETNRRRSQWFGKADGGQGHVLEVPDDRDYQICGMYCGVGDWMDAIGMLYTHR
ncbi:hypothetical protein DICA1_F44100 [Diutina catenulata]